MAKVIFGPIVAEARGKQGNLVFSRNAAGAYTRAWVAPDETETPARRVVWDRFAAACAAWTDGLTPSQRDAWSAFASRLSRNPGPINGRPVTGRSIFLHTFTNLDNLSLPTLEDPPTPALLGAISELSLYVHSLDEEIMLDRVEPTEAPEQGLIIFATPPLPYARNSAAGLLKQIAALPPDTEYPVNLWTSYLAVYAPPAPGDRIIAQATPVAAATGLAGTPLRASALNIVVEEVMLTKTVTITSEQILNLMDNPVDVIPAPGPGKAIFLFGAVFNSHDGAAYKNLGTQRVCLSFGGIPAYPYLTCAFFAWAILWDIPSTYYAGYYGLDQYDFPNFFENLPLQFAMKEKQGGNVTEGTAVVDITIFYAIAPMP